jgi:hypothetical protein
MKPNNAWGEKENPVIWYKIQITRYKNTIKFRKVKKMVKEILIGTG